MSKRYTVNDLTKDNFQNTQAIGFFSGAGGLDIGTQLAGAKVISSMDFDADSIATLKANNYFSHSAHIHADIREMAAKDYKEIIELNNPEKLILVGGPPCQPFSKAGYWVKNENRKANDDPRNMIGNYLRMIEELQPNGFLLENVESILHPTNKIAVEILTEEIDRLGYHLHIEKANALDFGVPQKRKRVFFIASKNEIVGTPTKTHGTPEDIILNDKLVQYESALDWIGDLDVPELFEKEEVTLGKTYSEDLHLVPPGKNYIALTERAGFPNAKFVAGTRFWSFLLKLHPDLPSWTIPAQPGPWVGPFHWTGRRLRVSEIAALQTFPEDYIFKGSRRSVQRQIGNAVPSLMGKSMVEFLMQNI
ncbi:MAG: DNA cytosine methyltransferase [Sphingobacterium sp.]|jgi:DNA (cytosine-5)-methyltransferase 1|nr:DNA cytosine methyltransferase [Sphingobacterium sp.]